MDIPKVRMLTNKQKIILIRSCNDGVKTYSKLDELASILIVLGYDVTEISCNEYSENNPRIFKIAQWIPSSIFGYLKTPLATAKLYLTASLVFLFKNSINPVLVVVEEFSYILALFSVYGNLKFMHVDDVLKNIPTMSELEDTKQNTDEPEVVPNEREFRRRIRRRGVSTPKRRITRVPRPSGSSTTISFKSKTLLEINTDEIEKAARFLERSREGSFKTSSAIKEFGKAMLQNEMESGLTQDKTPLPAEIEPSPDQSFDTVADEEEYDSEDEHNETFDSSVEQQVPDNSLATDVEGTEVGTGQLEELGETILTTLSKQSPKETLTIVAHVTPEGNTETFRTTVSEQTQTIITGANADEETFSSHMARQAPPDLSFLSLSDVPQNGREIFVDENGEEFNRITRYKSPNQSFFSYVSEQTATRTYYTPADATTATEDEPINESALSLSTDYTDSSDES